ncbi:MAG: M56 family metallopeptidase [Tepidisphaeraceae bacterium]
MSSHFLAMTESSVAAWLVRTSWQAAVLVLIVASMQLIFGRWLAPRWRYAMWMLIVVRLLMPALPSSPWSVFNLRMAKATQASMKTDATGSAKPQAADGVTVTITRTFDVDATPTNEQPATAAIPAPFDWRRAALAIWLAGAMLLLVRVIVAHAWLARRIRRSSPVESHILALLDNCRREMGARNDVRVVATDAVGGPALFGFLRPRLLVPPAMLREMSPDDLRFVFLHELAHLKRRDTLTNIALTLAQAMHWFNPAAWFALSRCRAERELACDAMVLDVTDSPGAQASYGHTMLRLAESLCATRGRSATPAALGMLHTRSQLKRRIMMISAFSRRPQSSRWSVLPALLLLTVASCALTDKASSNSAATQPTTAPAPKADAKSVATLRAQANQLVSATKYADALAVIDRILALDPADEHAVAVRPLVEDKASLQAGRTADNAKREELSNPNPNDATRALLERKLPEYRLDKAPLSDVIDAFRDLIGANIFVNWRALEAAGIGREQAVSARLRDVRAAKALDIILAEAGGDKVKLGYTIDDGVITISTEDDLASDTLTRVYDVRDLTALVPDHVPPSELTADVQPQGKPGPASQPATTAPALISLVKQIMGLIQETVRPDAWREAGGKIASMRELEGQLIITATPDMHAAIDALLRQVREGRGVQVVVETRFIAVEPAELDRAMGGKLLNTLGKAGAATVWQLADDEATAVIDASKRSPDASLITAPRLTLFSGQRGYVTVSTQTAYVSGFTVIKPDAGETRYEPQVSLVTSGVNLDVRATSSADRKSATLTIKPTLSHLNALNSVPYHGGGKDLFVQVPDLLVRELQTTLSIPDRGTALLGGFVESSGELRATFKGNKIAGDPGMMDHKPEDGKPIATTGPTGPTSRPVQNLYLLVKPTLIIAEVEKPTEFPLLKTQGK